MAAAQRFQRIADFHGEMLPAFAGGLRMRRGLVNDGANPGFPAATRTRRAGRPGGHHRPHPACPH
jgi:hypothetical protein